MCWHILSHFLTITSPSMSLYDNLKKSKKIVINKMKYTYMQNNYLTLIDRLISSQFVKCHDHYHRQLVDIDPVLCWLKDEHVFNNIGCAYKLNLIKRLII